MIEHVTEIQAENSQNHVPRPPELIPVLYDLGVFSGKSYEGTTKDKVLKCV